MKSLFIFLLLILLLFVQSGVAVQNNKMAKPKPPKECRVSKYTCILKKVDGVPFYCVRTTKQRYQNARKKIRTVSKRNCLRRYPVEYESTEQ